MDDSHPNMHGYPSWAPDPSARDQYNPSIDECGNIYSRAICTLSILSDTATTSIQKHDQQPTAIDYDKLKPYFGWVNGETIQKTLRTPLNWLSHPLDSP